MTASLIDYASQLDWVNSYLVDEHTATCRKTAWAVQCVLLGQSLTPADMARALPMDESGSGRNRLRRVHRWKQGGQWESKTLSRQLIKSALALMCADRHVVVALDTTRAGRWEIFLAGMVFEHRVLPVAWAVIPYPWPKGSFRKVVIALIEELVEAFPKGVQWTLVADRGFSSTGLFAELEKNRVGFTIRLRLSDWVEVEGVYAQVKYHLEQGRLTDGKLGRAVIGKGTKDYPATESRIGVSSQVREPPKHKQNPGTQRERQARQKAKDKHDKDRNGKPPSELARKYSQTWVLFTTAPSVEGAVAGYSQRMAIEESLRDLHQAWKLRKAVAPVGQQAHASWVVGIAVLAYRLQVELGLRLSQSAQGRLRRRQWTATDRVSLFWCGGQVFKDRGHDWSRWLNDQWMHLAVHASDHNSLPTAA